MQTRSLDGGFDSPVNASQRSSTNLKRRGFLLALSAGGASAGAVAVSALPGVAAANPSASTSAASADGAGYRESEHVRDYYRTARI